MNIQSVGQNYLQSRVYNNPVQNRQNTLLNVRNSNVSFGATQYYEEFKVYEAFDPYNASDKELDELAEICHKDSNFTRAIEERYTSGFLGFHAREAERKRQVSKERLTPKVNRVISDKNRLLRKSGELSAKAALGKSNTVDQKLNVQQQFLTPLKMSSRRNLANITNGIVIYGKASSGEKRDFEKWLLAESADFGTGSIVVNYEPDSPEESMELIKTALENAKQYNQLTGGHTIIVVKDIDDLLSSYNDDDMLDYIDYFKAMVEDAGDKYHATFVVNTDYSLKNFDSATMGDQRFGLKINLNGGITEAEEAELKKVNKEIDRLNSQAAKVSEYYGYETESYDDDWYGSMAEQIGR